MIGLVFVITVLVIKMQNPVNGDDLLIIFGSALLVTFSSSGFFKMHTRLLKYSPVKKTGNNRPRRTSCKRLFSRRQG
jgi:hypothetical protein